MKEKKPMIFKITGKNILIYVYIVVFLRKELVLLNNPNFIKLCREELTKIGKKLKLFF